MKHLYLTLIALFAVAACSQAQKLPSVNLKDLDGNRVNIAELAGDGTPTIVCFWATWCSPCKRELNNYMDYYADWQDETGAKLIAVSIDDTRSQSRVAPYVMSSGWEYTVLLDPNKDLSRAMNVINVPHTFLINGEGEIVWSHNNYAEGDEEELEEELHKLVE